jgi:hypothetical protein
MIVPTTATAIAPVVPLAMALVPPVAALFPAIVAILAIVWNIDIVVPLVPHEIRRPAAGTVFVAMLGMPGRHMQIDWPGCDRHRYAVYHHRRLVNMTRDAAPVAATRAILWHG